VTAQTEAPDTPRRHLLVLAHRALALPHASREDIEDEVSLVAAVADRAEREREFARLLDALAAADHDAAETALARLTGKTITDPSASSGAGRPRLGADEGDPGRAGGSRPGSPPRHLSGPSARSLADGAAGEAAS